MAKSGLPVQKAGEQMTQGYQITARGEYYAKNRDLKIYMLTFFIPKIVEVQVRRDWKWFKSGKSKIKRSVPVYDQVNGRENAQHIIQRLLLPSELSEKYPDSMGHKTCRIVDVKIASRPASEFGDITKKPVAKMSRNELSQFCSLHSLKVPLESFGDIIDARQAVQDSYDESTMYAQEQKGADSDLEKIDPDKEDDAAGPGDGEVVTEENDFLS